MIMGTKASVEIALFSRAVNNRMNGIDTRKNWELVRTKIRTLNDSTMGPPATSRGGTYFRLDIFF